MLDTSKLGELVGESGRSPVLAPTPPGAADTVETIRPTKANAPALAASRSKYTPTLRSVDFDGRSRTAPLWPLIVGVVTFGAGIGTFLGTRATPAAPVADEIELSVTVDPAAATMRLDGQPLPGNPHSSKHPRDGQRHTLVVEATGHQSQSLDVVFDSSTTIDLTLPKTGGSK